MRNCKEIAKILFMVMFAVLTGCSGGSNSQPGTLGVSLTDAPASGFDAVYVTVSKVRVHKSATATENDPGWSDITLNPPQKINLLNLTNGVLDDLGQTSLPAGHYTQLRLVLSQNTGTNIANSVVLSGTTTEIPLVTPSALQSGIKLINEFDVASGQHVDLVLDFDALKSVVPNGNGSYTLMPVIKVIPNLLTGIDGFVNASGSNVMVSAQVNGAEIRSTMTNTVTGEFFLSNLDAGTYDVVITADGHATAVISGVPVSAATSTAGATIVSTSAAPISLPTSTTRNLSGTVTLSPAPSSTSATVAYVASLQAFTGGPTVTITSQPVDVSSGSGAYSLALPVDSPLLASYGTGTLVFTPQSAAAGQYTAQASASGYQTESVNEDLSSADATYDFTLPLLP